MPKNSLLLVFLFLLSGNSYSQWLGNASSKTIVSKASFDNRYPMAVPSGDGGSIVVFATYAEFTEEVPFPLPSLCVQKIKSDGTVAWGTVEAPVVVDSLILDEWFYTPKLSVKSDGNGGIYIAWAETFYDDSLFVQHIGADGQLLWDAKGKVVFAVGYQEVMDGISICVGSDKSVVVGWNAMNTTTNRYRIYAQRYNESGAEQWGANGKEVSLAAGSRKGELVTDGAGGVIALFYDTRDSGMYAQRIDSGGNFRWAAGGINICPVPGTRFIRPGMRHYGPGSYAVADGNGGAIVMFNDNRNSSIDSIYGQAYETNMDVYAQKVNADGSLPWGKAGIAVALRKARVNDDCEQVYADAHGGAIVQSENVSNEQHATCKLVQRISAAGGRMWGDSGIVLTRGRSDEFYSNIQPDDSGNTYAGFLYIPQPYHESATPLLAMRKINGAGQDLWSSNGTLIRNGFVFSHPFSGAATAPQTDGSAILAWPEGEGYRLVIAGGKITAAGSLAKSPTTFTTIADGNWDDPTIWAGGIVPDADAIVVIKSKVTINVSISCYSLKVEQPGGGIKVNPDVKVGITH
jgi:hypothetical protein